MNRKKIRKKLKNLKKKRKKLKKKIKFSKNASTLKNGSGCVPVSLLRCGE